MTFLIVPLSYPDRALSTRPATVRLHWRFLRSASCSSISP